MTIDELRKTVEKLGLAIDKSTGEILIEWEKIPFSDQDRPDWAALSSIKGIGPQTLPVLATGLGSIRKVFNKSRSQLHSLGLPEHIIKSILHFRKVSPSPQEWFLDQTRGGQQLNPQLSFIAAPEKIFPPQLRQFSNSPAQLWIWGDPGVLKARIPVAVVGTRKITPYGRMATTEITAALSSRGCVIVSGLMYGVDEVAMRAALNVGGLTIGVWAGGITKRSLGSRWRLAGDVVAGGGVVISEFPPDQFPTKGLFPTRNRIVSGLSKAVLVTEGASRSGSLITARFGIEQGRPVFAVPGPVNSSLSTGPNELLKLGAHAATGADDILDLLGQTTGGNNQASPHYFPYEPKTESEAAVIDALSSYPKSVDVLVRETNMSVGQISETLIELELTGAIKSLGDEWSI